MNKGSWIRLATTLSLFFVIPACTSGKAVTHIRDIGRQAVMMETARAPHLKGPELREGQTLLAGNYHISLAPEADGLRSSDEKAPGGVVSTHSWDLRFSKAISKAHIPGGSVWEFGLNVGITHPSLGNPQAQNVQISRFDDLYVRGGIGFRGPVYQKNKFSLGIVFEGDFAALPYSVDVVRNTDLSIETVTSIWLPLGHHGGVIDLESGTELSEEDSKHITGHAFFPTFRGGLYGAYYFNNRVSITFGMAFQNTPAVRGTELQEYSCVYEDSGFVLDSIPDDVAAQCREDKGEDFPIIGHALAGTLYGGVHVNFEPMVLTLRLQNHLVFSNIDAYAAPVSGDLELSYRF